MIKLISSYISYASKTKNLHRVHSPFVYQLYNEVILSKRDYYSFPKIERRRKELLSNNSALLGNDPGAGSKTKSKKISEHASKSLVSPTFGSLLFKLSMYLECNTILELGTSFGLSTAYLASASSSTKVHTVEGRTEIAEVAKTTFEALNLSNIILHKGLFDDVLPVLLPQLKSLDLVFLDGNHQEISTLKYVEMIKPYLHENSLIIVDDIRWSTGMWKAWQKLKTDKDFHVSIDIMRMGLLFTRPNQVKEDFTLYFR